MKPAPFEYHAPTEVSEAVQLLAALGDITRFRTPGQLASWAGLTPRHHESDVKVIRGHVSKQGSRMLRWAVTEAIQRQPVAVEPEQSEFRVLLAYSEAPRKSGSNILAVFKANLNGDRRSYRYF